MGGEQGPGALDLREHGWGLYRESEGGVWGSHLGQKKGADDWTPGVGGRVLGLMRGKARAWTWI